MTTDSLTEFHEIPVHSYELIRTLDRALPPRCISPGETVEAAHRYAGARELIDTLVEMMNDEIQGQDNDPGRA